MRRNEELEELLSSLSPKAIFYFGMAYDRALVAIELTDNFWTEDFLNCRKELNRFLYFRTSINPGDTRSHIERIRETLEAAHMYAVEAVHYRAKNIRDVPYSVYCNVEWSIREAVRRVKQAVEGNDSEGDDT